MPYLVLTGRFQIVESPDYIDSAVIAGALNRLFDAGACCQMYDYLDSFGSPQS